LNDGSLPAYGDDWGVTWQRGDRDPATQGTVSALTRNTGTPVFFGHAGSVPGYLCFAWRDPKNDITIVWFGASSLGRDRSASGRLEWMLEGALFELALGTASR